MLTELEKEKLLAFAIDADEVATNLYDYDVEASRKIYAQAEIWYFLAEEELCANKCRMIRVGLGSSEQADEEYTQALLKVKKTISSLNLLKNISIWGLGNTPKRKMPAHYH